MRARRSNVRRSRMHPCRSLIANRYHAGLDLLLRFPSLHGLLQLHLGLVGKHKLLLHLHTRTPPPDHKLPLAGLMESAPSENKRGSDALADGTHWRSCCVTILPADVERSQHHAALSDTPCAKSAFAPTLQMLTPGRSQAGHFDEQARHLAV